jgi:putative endonuclease
MQGVIGSNPFTSTRKNLAFVGFFYAMDYSVYIIRSEGFGKWYIGQTEDLESRLKKHNSGANISTRRGIPWILVAFKRLDKRSDAMVMERKLKNLKSRKKQMEFMLRNNFTVIGVIGPEKPDS